MYGVVNKLQSHSYFILLFYPYVVLDRTPLITVLLHWRAILCKYWFGYDYDYYYDYYYDDDDDDDYY